MPDLPDIQSRLATFQNDLRQFSAADIVRKHITFGRCCALNEDQYYLLKNRISNDFNVNTNEVLVVGSAKLGFSIAPQKRYRHFGDTSDVDVAIISPALFDQFWEAAFKYENSRAYWPTRGDFVKYHFRGWIRPDKLPPSATFHLAGEWWERFRVMTQEKLGGGLPIKAGLYRSWSFLEAYQSQCVSLCLQDI